jgi:hypothetical protein
MIPAAQPTIEDLEEKQVADLRARREPVTLRASANTGWRNDAPELAHLDDIQIDGSQRVLIPAPEGLAGRFWLIVGALIAASGWVAVSLLPMPIASPLVDKPRASSVASAHAFESKKGDRLQISKASMHELATKAAAPSAPQRQSSPEAQRKTAGQVGETPRHTAPVRARVRELESIKRTLPVPETRPTTVEGWTLRDVTNGTAVLDGPNGTWRAARGDTVPGLGKVDSIFKWGNRLMVATSRGLIATP